MRDGSCSVLRDGLTPLQRIVPPEHFYTCFWEYDRHNGDDFHRTAVNPNTGQRVIVGLRDKVYYRRIGDSAIEGVQFLKDLRFLEKEYGIG